MFPSRSEISVFLSSCIDAVTFFLGCGAKQNLYMCKFTKPSLKCRHGGVYLENAAPLLLLLLGEETGVPVEALDDEDVLEDELQQAEERVRQVEAPQRPLRPHGEGRHQGKIGKGELAQSCGDQEEHVQATSRVVSAFVRPPLQPVDQHPGQAAERHHGHDAQVVAVEYEEGGEAKLLLTHPNLVEDEDCHSCDEDESAKHQAEYDPTLIDDMKGQLLGDVVVIWTHPAAHVLPHHVDHAAGHQVVLHVEGVKDFDGFPEGEAGCTRTALTEG